MANKTTSNKMFVSSSSTSTSRSQISRLFAVMAILIVIVNVTLFMPTKVTARYLPTRSNDQLRRQEIKEILRLLLDLPSDESNGRVDSGPIVWSGNGRPSDAYDVSSIRVARQIQNQEPSMVNNNNNGMVTNQRTKRSIQQS